MMVMIMMMPFIRKLRVIRLFPSLKPNVLLCRYSTAIWCFHGNHGNVKKTKQALREKSVRPTRRQKMSFQTTSLDRAGTLMDPSPLPREDLILDCANTANQTECYNEVSSRQVLEYLSHANNDVHNLPIQESSAVAVATLQGQTEKRKRAENSFGGESRKTVDVFPGQKLNSCEVLIGVEITCSNK